MNPALKKMEYPDMSSIVKSLSASGEIRFYQEDLVRSDLWYEKHGIRQWEIAWKDGTLLDIRTGEKFLHFHFIRSKASPRFHVEPCHTGKEFRIKPTGIKPVG
jgi:hypothetical protein